MGSSPPENHYKGDPIFIFYTKGLEVPIPRTGRFYLKLVPFGATGTGSLADAIPIEVNPELKAKKPWAPEKVKAQRTGYDQVQVDVFVRSKLYPGAGKQAPDSYTDKYPFDYEGEVVAQINDEEPFVTTPNFTITGRPEAFTLTVRTRWNNYLSDPVSVDVPSGAPWFDTSFRYRRQITITNPTGETLSDFQVLIVLNGDNFDFSKARPNGEDIRFHDGDNLLPYWIEEWDSGSQTARIWVKVPEIPIEGTAIWMYYGNENAESESDGVETFVFFDDFEPDKQTWTVLAGDWSNEEGAKKGVHTGGEYRQSLLGEWIDLADFILHARVRSTVDGSLANIVFRASDDSNDGNDRIWARLDQRPPKSNHEGGFHLVEDQGGSESTKGYCDFDPVVGKWYDIELRIHSATVEGYLDGEHKWTATVSRTEPGYLLLQVEWSSGHDAWFDHIYIRKYAEQDPEVSIGMEEEVS